MKSQIHDEIDLAENELINLPAKLLEHSQTRPNDVAMRHKRLGIWKEFTWEEYLNKVVSVSLGFYELGVREGDKVAIHSENRPEWVFADLAAQTLGSVSVGIYPTSPASEVEYLLSHSEASVLVVEDEEQLDKALDAWDRLEKLQKIVVIDPRGVKELNDPRIITFEDLLDLGDLVVGKSFEEMTKTITSSETAIIVYTSGTTGPPKGAMITHENLRFAAITWGLVYEYRKNDEVLSYLPLCHVAERVISVANAVYHGYVVNFGEDTNSFTEDLREVQPTFFLGVPRVWEKMLAAVQIRSNDATWLKRSLFNFWIKQGGLLLQRRLKNKSTFIDSIWFGIGWLFVFRSLKKRLGMMRVREALSGAAPIAPQVLEFLMSVGVPVREGYGMTENTAVATIVPADELYLGSVGKALPLSEVRIAEDGEILTRSDGTFKGYFKNLEATKETIIDGWLHTGDVGRIDEFGHLWITDRKKDIIITAGGKNLSPSEIENRIKISPYVREAMVIGDKRKYLTALIGIESDTVGDWATRKGIPYTTYEDLSSKDEVNELVSMIINDANKDFAQVETVKYFKLIPLELDHEDGQLTATQKVKRAAITEQFAELIESMY
ncbi:MAG: AMP-dependent synthetase/ligase [Acidimicrobiales bacterium]|nr:long-chain fatty acid--CoA ligase [Actinomycetota bacterium]MAU50756.1 long-chain fatty acid--CoA ligase [Actinomycetota bacterium]MCH1513613.1 AMP-binding protein [Acidimicrobiales bacterium]HAQ04602.1 long-chain fatty acid--CoA ligase [Acidimicrobiaceae bacterium]|tara:strand:+ start:1596 stop:3419 length:1824 start_codon:yes stop_codon:yes gene_type:complete